MNWVWGKLDASKKSGCHHFSAEASVTSKNHLLEQALDAEGAEAESSDAAVDVNKVFPRKFTKGG